MSGKPSKIGSLIGLVACVVSAGCSGLQIQPQYGSDGSGLGGAYPDMTSATLLVVYEATCEGRCTIRFSLPGATPGAEQFETKIRRNIRFPAGSARGVTMTVEPLDERYLVRRAQIQVDGEVRAYLRDKDVSRGEPVSLTTALLPKR